MIPMSIIKRAVNNDSKYTEALSLILPTVGDLTNNNKPFELDHVVAIGVIDLHEAREGEAFEESLHGVLCR